MKKQTLLVTTVITGLLTFATMSYAGPDDHGKGGHGKYSEMSEADKAERMQKRLDRMAKKLDLTDEQKTKVQALKLNSRNIIKPLRDERRAIREEMRALDTAAADYSSKLASIANRQAANTSAMIIAKGERRQQMASILTPEQSAKMKEMRGKRKGGFGKRKHRKHN